MSLSESKPRALLFVHDGNSLGHLRRVARIGQALHPAFSCLILTGMRQAASMMPDECELLLLPRWDGLMTSRAEQKNRMPWWSESRSGSVAFRKRLIESAFEAFNPDIVIVDYLPFGQYAELKLALQETRAKKYLLLRGVIDTPDLAAFSGAAADEVAACYQKMLIAADPNVVDVAARFIQAKQLVTLMHYTGYVAPQRVSRSAVRARHGIREGAVWVVCSAGGGRNAEDFIERCIGLSCDFPDLFFDVIRGPMSSARTASPAGGTVNLRIQQSHADAPDMHGAADIVLCCGGYNTLCESMVGGARIIVFPNQTGGDDEQVSHVNLLKEHYPIGLVLDLDRLKAALAQALSEHYSGKEIPPQIRFDGSDVISEIAQEDCGLIGVVGRECFE